MFALLNFFQIEEDEKINHNLNGGIHLAIVLFGMISQGIIFGLTLLFIGRLIFDSSLNLFRKKGLGYVPENPASKIDRIEKSAFEFIHKIFKTISYSFIVGILPKIIYLIVIIVLNIFYIH
jgi:uncharacterized membrane protein